MLTSTRFIAAAIRLIWMSSLLQLGGCASSVPTYPPVSDRGSLDVLADRANSVRSIRATIELNVIDDQGQSIELDGAIAAVLPDRLRLQAWKMGVTVLDVTYKAGEVWTVTDDDHGSGQEIESLTGTSAADFEQMLAPTRAEFWRKARAVGSGGPDRDLVVESAWPIAGAMTCFIDRKTLTARRLNLADGQTNTTAARSLILEKYQNIDGVVWPTRMIFIGADGTVRVNLKDVEINQPIDDTAFLPPRRAKKHP